jgi:hypothetical protein
VKRVKREDQVRTDLTGTGLSKMEGKVYKLLLSMGDGGIVADVAISSGALAKKIKRSLSNTKKTIRALISKGFIRRGGIKDGTRILQVFAPADMGPGKRRAASKPASTPVSKPPSKNIDSQWQPFDQKPGQSLYAWMEQQKELYFKGELPASKIILLEVLPKWDWIPDRIYKEILRKMVKNGLSRPEFSIIGRKLTEFTIKPEEITFKETATC